MLLNTIAGTSFSCTGYAWYMFLIVTLNTIYQFFNLIGERRLLDTIFHNMIVKKT